MRTEEIDLRHWVRRVAEGKTSRRQFMRALLEAGLSAPFVANLLAAYTPAASQGARVAPSDGTRPTRSALRALDASRSAGEARGCAASEKKAASKPPHSKGCRQS